MRPSLFILTVFLISCGSQNSTHFLENPSETQAAETTDYPAVVRVISPNGRGLCTGTFVHPRVVITAAHCTITRGTYRVITDWGTFSTAEVARHGSGTVGDSQDIALLVFDLPVATETNGRIIPFSLSLEKGSAVRLVGFGCDDVETRLGTNVKRTGTNRVARLSDFVEIDTPRNAARALLGPQNLTGTCFGDSGSPLLKVETRGLWVTGISHGGSWDARILTSLFTDLGRIDNFNFLEKAEKDYGVMITKACDVLNVPQCHPDQAATGIVGFLRWVFAKVLSWWGF